MNHQMKIQHEIKAKSDETMNSFQDLYSWQKEMKEKEKARLKGGQSENSFVPDVRSKMQNNVQKNLSDKESVISSTDHLKNENIKNEQQSHVSEQAIRNVSKQNEGDLYKEKGNNLVKLGKHEEALYYYTAAINHFDKEPIYFANRALCYLKLEKYADCIEDCNRAITLNKTNVKAHYRRMQAYEYLGENEEALKSCEVVLKLDPKNIEAKTGHQRILNRIKKSEMIKQQKPNFTDHNKMENMQTIEMYNKSPHLRSKKIMKKIKIKEVIGGKAPQIHISDEVLDKLFTNNNVGNYEEIKKSSKIQNKASIQDINMNNIENDGIADNINFSANKFDNDEDEQPKEMSIKCVDEIKTKNQTSNIKFSKSINNSENISVRNKTIADPLNFTIPLNPTQFYSVWKELSPENRYIYFKMIPVTNLNKILGAGLEPDTLTEVFQILHEYYIKNNEEIINILKEISVHDEFKILSMFFSKDDREILMDFVKYMKKRNNNPKDIENITDLYYLKEEL